jgi:hypothetical protein
MCTDSSNSRLFFALPLLGLGENNRVWQVKAVSHLSILTINRIHCRTIMTCNRLRLTAVVTDLTVACWTVLISVRLLIS